MEAFILHGDVTCPNCLKKDNSEINNLKNYLSENSISSLDVVAHQTGISVTNLNRYIKKDDFIQVRKQLKENNVL